MRTYNARLRVCRRGQLQRIVRVAVGQAHEHVVVVLRPRPGLRPVERRRARGGRLMHHVAREMVGPAACPAGSPAGGREAAAAVERGDEAAEQAVEDGAQDRGRGDDQGDALLGRGPDHGVRGREGEVERADFENGVETQGPEDDGASEGESV